MVHGKSGGTEPATDVLFARRLAPHRSLGRRHFRLLLTIVCGVNLFVGIPFAVLGAWPVAGFMGLDVAIFCLAFRAHARKAQAYEEVAISYFELVVAKVSAAGEQAEYCFNPAFVRLEREDDEATGTQKLALVSQGKSLEIASFLGPAEKADLALALTRALVDARRGPRYE